MSETSSADIQQARRSFFRDGLLPADQLSHAVLRSWMRCAEQGLNAAVAPAVEPMTQGELKLAWERHELLRRLSRPELDALWPEARETGALVVLTNAEGLVLDSIGDAGFAGRAAEVALRPGAAWSESAAGTNAIGAALAERRPVAVHGGEHFFEAHRILSCASAPILDSRGVAVGCLDLSCRAGERPTHALGLARYAADQIERRLFDHTTTGQTVVRFHAEPALLEGGRAGALVFEDGRLAGGNRRGLALLNRGWEHLDAVGFDELFAADLDRLPPNVELMTPGGERFHARVSRPTTSAVSLCGRTAETLADAELAAMQAALAACGGNVSKAARRLGVHRSTLYRRLFS